MSRHLALAAGLIAALAASCANGYPSAPAATPSPIGSAAPRGQSAEIELDVTGVTHDGSYRAVSPGRCESNPALNKFTVAYADDAAPDGFVALDLVLNDAALAQQDESDDFVAHISLGGAGAGVSYTLDPANDVGDGTALLDVGPSGATIDVSADADDGASIELSVICGQD